MTTKQTGLGVSRSGSGGGFVPAGAAGLSDEDVNGRMILCREAQSQRKGRADEAGLISCNRNPGVSPAEAPVSMFFRFLSPSLLHREKSKKH